MKSLILLTLIASSLAQPQKKIEKRGILSSYGQNAGLTLGVSSLGTPWSPQSLPNYGAYGGGFNGGAYLSVTGLNTGIPGLIPGTQAGFAFQNPAGFGGLAANNFAGVGFGGAGFPTQPNAGFPGVGFNSVDLSAAGFAANGFNGLARGIGPVGFSGAANLGGGANTFSQSSQVVNIPSPFPIPVPVNRQIPVPVPQAVPVVVNRPVNVPVSQPVPVLVPRPYTVNVPRPVSVPVPQKVPVPVQRAIPVSVPQPYAVSVPQAVPVHVPQPVGFPNQLG